MKHVHKRFLQRIAMVDKVLSQQIWGQNMSIITVIASDFINAGKNGIMKSFDWVTRSSRSEYWYWIPFAMLSYMALGFISVALGLGIIIPIIYIVIIILGSIGLTIRRLHDINRSGMWILISFVPIIGELILLYWSIIKGTDGPNQYGPDPLAPSEENNN